MWGMGLWRCNAGAVGVAVQVGFGAQEQGVVWETQSGVWWELDGRDCEDACGLVYSQEVGARVEHRGCVYQGVR